MTIFPLKSDKAPSVAAWQTYTGDVISQMYGIKIPTGFIVIDLDSYKGITEQDIEKLFGCEFNWDDAFAQSTLNGGKHFIFTVPEHSELKQGSNLFALQGFDTRVANKGYIASGEGYTTKGGGKVEELFDDMFAPELPQAAIDKLTDNRQLALVDDLDSLVNKNNIALSNDNGTYLTIDQIENTLNRLPEDVGTDNESWMTVCAGLKRQFLGSGETEETLNDRNSAGYKVLDKWSSKRTGYDSKIEQHNFTRWCSFTIDNSNNPVTFASVVNLAGGFPSITTDKKTGEEILSDGSFMDNYVMNASGKYVSKISKTEYVKAAFDTMHALDTPENAKGGHIKPSKFAEGRIDMIARTLYAPAFPLLFELNDNNYLNTYKPQIHPDVTQEQHDAAKLLLTSHIGHLLVKKEEQDIVLNYLAFCVQNPGEKIPWAIILQGCPGDGKSFFAEMMQLVLGTDNVNVMNASTLENSFSGWATGQCLKFIEELKIDNFKKYEIVNRIKPFISNPTIESVSKGKDPITVPNTTNYFCFTNHKDAIPLDDNDRRYAILYSQWQDGKKMTASVEAKNKNHYAELYEQMRNSIPALYKVLKTHEIPKWFNDQKRAPLTHARQEMIEFSKSPCTIAMEYALEIFPECLVDGILNITELNRKVRIDQNINVDDVFEEYPNTRIVKSVLSGLGFNPHGKRKKIDGIPCNFFIKG